MKAYEFYKNNRSRHIIIDYTFSDNMPFIQFVKKDKFFQSTHEYWKRTSRLFYIRDLQRFLKKFQFKETTFK